MKSIIRSLFTLSVMSLGLIVVSCSGGSESDKSDSAGIVSDTSKRQSKNIDGDSESHESVYRVVDGKIVNNAGRPLVVDFYADWCPPCRQMKPVFSALAKEFKGKVDFVSVNVDIEGELAQTYRVSSIPYFIFIDGDGKVVHTITGSTPEPEFRNAVESSFLNK
ncbi:MAG: thioredoxin family protein [Bacteroidales bacterium]|nr:thioredoxin family protein [Bacteroidales bacterium]